MKTTKKTSIGTARHLHPAGTPGDLCRWHNRAALATTVAAIARRHGLDASADDGELAACAAEAKAAPLKAPLSADTLAAIRSALGPALGPGSAPAAVAEAVFGALPDRPIRVAGQDGQEFFLVPIPATP
ncbi:hypothetical protein GCM10010519_01820 [Streptomyces lactacystinicus]|uniref:Uncharacterized protein n=1 Tax=Streptomyces kaniharaensis TaxID=212423 RepID=A0A6N7L0K9_9ACTN|nr:hypothetical protein [Streptomyces kaniharaensis]MQS17270.1 hypothetical protein [Streptomyces kaniharaensis]